MRSASLLKPQQAEEEAIELGEVLPIELQEKESFLGKNYYKSGEEEQQKSLPPPAAVSAASDLRCLCFNLTHTAPVPRFLLLVAGVFFFFMLNSYVEEYTFKQLPHFEFGWYLTFFELFCFSLFALFERFLNQQLGTSSPSAGKESLFSHQAAFSRHLIVSLAMTASRGLTNVSLQYLNYPTQVIFKSMKLITVMIGSLFILKSSFSLLEYVSAVTLVVSACLFSLGDADVTPHYSSLGLFVVLLSLVFDAIHANTQETLLKEHKATTTEAMLFTNLFSAGFALVIVVLSGELFPAIQYCSLYPSSYFLFVLRAAVIYGGVLCFVTLIKSNGVVTATSVTTVRKILSILMSFVLFPKPFTEKYIWGVVTFAVSVLLSYYDVRQKHLNKGKK